MGARVERLQLRDALREIERLHAQPAGAGEWLEQENALILSLLEPVTDIFVETDGDAYFRKPDFAADGLSARLVIDNVKDGDTLIGKVLNLTIDRQGAGLEQRITLA